MVLFVAGAIAFIFFASRQHVNLVHKDYYEKGVDYSEQMAVETRSKPYNRSIRVSAANDFLLVEIEKSLASEIDSGSILMYRPSDSKKDVSMPLEHAASEIRIPKKDLVHGRYILKFHWFSEGLKYEVDRPVNVQ